MFFSLHIAFKNSTNMILLCKKYQKNCPFTYSSQLLSSHFIFIRKKTLRVLIPLEFYFSLIPSKLHIDS